MAKWPYNTQRWQKLRRRKLRQQPLCERCEAQGKLTPAQDVDHIKPISNGGEAFPALDGLAALCHSCHAVKTRDDERGVVRGAGADGLPLDPEHPWYGDE